MGASLVFANVSESFTQNLIQAKAVAPSSNVGVNTTTPKSKLTSVPKLNTSAQLHKTGQEQVNVAADTSSQIVKIWNRGDQFYIQLNLADYNSDVSLSAYNLIGKEVKKIYHGAAKSKGEYYEFSSEEMPNGVYFCILQGKNFRSVSKFIISKR